MINSIISRNNRKKDQKIDRDIKPKLLRNQNEQSIFKNQIEIFIAATHCLRLVVKEVINSTRENQQTKLLIIKVKTSLKAKEITKRNLGKTPHITNHLFSHAKNYAALKNMNWYYLSAFIDKISHSPLSLNNIASSISDEHERLTAMIKPYLINKGYIMYTGCGQTTIHQDDQFFNFFMPAKLLLVA